MEKEEVSMDPSADKIVADGHFFLLERKKCGWTLSRVHPTTDHTNEKRFSFVVGLWCFLFSLPEEEKRKGRSSIDRSLQRSQLLDKHFLAEREEMLSKGAGLELA